MAPPPIYADPVDLGRFGVNAEAFSDLSDAEHQLPPLSSASRIMDSYLSKQFNLPLLAWGDDLRECCSVLAAWAMISTRGFKPRENPEDTPLEIRWKWWIDWLEKVAENDLTPVVTPTPLPTGGPTGMSAGAVVFSNESRGYQGEPGTANAFTGRRRP